MADSYELKNVEIFETGTHNGDKYTNNDLDSMVQAYREQEFIPPIKLGHSDEPGRPAVGWVMRLRRTGTKLVADFSHIPREVYDLIKRRGYDRVSAEVFWNLKQNGKTFRRALKAVALLGADIPAVTSLAPLHTCFAGCNGTVRHYDFYLTFGDTDMRNSTISLQDVNAALYSFAQAKQTAQPDKDTTEHARQILRENGTLAHYYATKEIADAPALAGELLHLHALEHQVSGSRDYRSCLQQAMRDHPHLARIYSNLDNSTEQTNTAAEDAGTELDRLAHQRVHRNGMTYSAALGQVMAENPALAARYNNVSTHKRYREGS